MQWQRWLFGVFCGLVLLASHAEAAARKRVGTPKAVVVPKATRSVNISWDAYPTTLGATGLQVMWCDVVAPATTCVPLGKTGPLALATTQYVDTGAPEGGTRGYALRALRQSESGPYGNVLYVQVPAPPLPPLVPPTGLHVVLPAPAPPTPTPTQATTP